LYQLNQLIPDHMSDEADATSLFISDRKTVELHPGYPVSCDATQLSTWLRRSWQHNHSDLLACPDCRLWLEEAVALYGGDFLADFSLYDSNSFEAWADATAAATEAMMKANVNRNMGG
jgi:hypothetical protein